MSNTLCDLKIMNPNTPMITLRNIGVSKVLHPFSELNRGWFEPISRNSLRLDLVYDICLKSISNNRFDEALDTMLTEVYGHCDVLAKIFGKELKGKEYISDLVEELRQGSLIDEEEADRLHIIIMALDGLEIQVREYGGEICQDDLEYIMEFFKITETILQKNKAHVGMSLPSYIRLDQDIAEASFRDVSKSYIIFVDEFLDCMPLEDKTNRFATTTQHSCILTSLK